MTMDRSMRLGLDIGSTTVKCAVMAQGKAVYSYYKRHMSDIALAVREMLEDAYAKIGDATVFACVTGSRWGSGSRFRSCRR